MPRPNIVFILADDMGYGDFSCFNGGISETPTLDRLAAEGICLTQHYSASPVCAPARAALLTGRYPHRTGAIDTLELRGLDRLYLDERTFADHLQAAGYATGLVGKWHNGALDRRYHPNRRGFDEFVGFSGGWSPYVDYHYDRNGQAAKSDGRYMTDMLTDEAVAFIDRHAGEEFALVLAYSAPHYPFHALEEDLAPFRDSGAFTAAVSHIYGMVRALDRGVGRVLNSLRRHGLVEDTFLVFTSDNGPQFTGHGDNSSHRFNCGFAGAKLLVYEGGIRVPAIVRWPAQLAGGCQIDDLVHFSDWFPTLLGIAGIDIPAERHIDGHDLSALLRGEPANLPKKRFWQWNRYKPVAVCNAAMRQGDWKLVLPAIDSLMRVTNEDFGMDVASKFDPSAYPAITDTPTPEAAPYEALFPCLFNLRDDPGEEHDLASLYPRRVAQMRSALAAWFEEVDAERRRHESM